MFSATATQSRSALLCTTGGGAVDAKEGAHGPALGQDEASDARARRVLGAGEAAGKCYTSSILLGMFSGQCVRLSLVSEATCLSRIVQQSSTDRTVL